MGREINHLEERRTKDAFQIMITFTRNQELIPQAVRSTASGIMTASPACYLRGRHSPQCELSLIQPPTTTRLQLAHTLCATCKKGNRKQMNDTNSRDHVYTGNLKALRLKQNHHFHLKINGRTNTQTYLASSSGRDVHVKE